MGTPREHLSDEALIQEDADDAAMIKRRLARVENFDDLETLESVAADLDLSDEL